MRAVEARGLAVFLTPLDEARPLDFGSTVCYSVRGDTNPKRKRGSGWLFGPRSRVGCLALARALAVWPSLARWLFGPRSRVRAVWPSLARWLFGPRSRFRVSIIPPRSGGAKMPAVP